MAVARNAGRTIADGPFSGTIQIPQTSIQGNVIGLGFAIAREPVPGVVWPGDTLLAVTPEARFGGAQAPWEPTFTFTAVGGALPRGGTEASGFIQFRTTRGGAVFARGTIAAIGQPITTNIDFTAET